MAILLAIIKTILKLLLIILALIIILILLILFVPFRYRAAGVKEPGTIEAEASVTWLLHMLTVEVGYSLTSGRRLTKDIRIFGISLFKLKNWLNDRRKSKAEKEKEKRRQEKKKKLERMKTEDPERYEQLRAEALARKQEEKRRKEEEERKRQEEEAKKKEAERVRLEAEKAEKEALRKKQEEEERIRIEAEKEAQRKAEKEARIKAESEARIKAESEARKKEEENETGQQTGQKGGGIFAKIMNAMEKIETRVAGKAYSILAKFLKLLLKLITTVWFLPWKIVSVIANVFEKIETVSERIDSLTDKASDIWEFLQDERTQEVLSLLKKQIGRLIGHIIPRMLNGYVQFGLDDPYLTGRVLATACVFYPLYGRTFRLEPDFEELVFNGRAELKGRIYLFYLGFIALSTYFNKNTKFVINYIKSFNNKEESE